VKRRQWVTKRGRRHEWEGEKEKKRNQIIGEKRTVENKRGKGTDYAKASGSRLAKQKKKIYTTQHNQKPERGTKSHQQETAIKTQATRTEIGRGR